MTEELDLTTLSDQDLDSLEREGKRQLAREDLAAFCAYVDERAAYAYQAPHMRAMASELEKVESGETTRLFLTAPPRHWKSSLASEKFALWYLSRHPTHTVGLFSHGASLPARFSNTVRNTILFNPHYREVFPEVNYHRGGPLEWTLTGAYRTSFRAMGVLASPTGEGFDLIIIDDPVADAAEAYNPLALEKIWTWYQETLRDRLQADGKIVLVMSRWHENDLAGRLMRASQSGDGEAWREVRFPAMAEEKDPLGRKPGEALWPEKWPLPALEAIYKAQGRRAFAARFQGSPRVMEGNLLNSSKLKLIELSEVPHLTKVVRRWDLAFSENNGADYAAGVKMGLDGHNNRYILHINRVHGRWPPTKREIMAQADRDGMSVIIGIEANGTQLGYAQDIKELLPQRTVLEDKPEGSKEMRATIWGSRLEDGIIYCVRGEWNQEFFDEMDFFPNGQHDDMVDGVSGAWKMLGEATGAWSASDIAALSRPAPGQDLGTSEAFNVNLTTE